MELEKAAEDVKKPDKLLGIRHLEAFLLFLAMAIAFAIRVSTSIGIVAMTDPTASTADVPVFPEWSKQTKDAILSSFFWAYGIFQIPIGLLYVRYGGKLMMIIVFLSNGITTLAIPFVATFGGWKAVCACRVIQGFCQAAVYPCMHGFQAKWAPISERSRITTFIYAGSLVGSVVELMTSGIISGSVGWPVNFYSLGVVSILWVCAWIFMGSDSPREHKWISEEELKYIEASYTEKKAEITTPWKSILMSLPIWSLILAHCAQNWGFWMLISEMPSYMKDVLNVDIKSNGILMALPYVTMFIFSFIFSYMSDFGINNKYVSRTAARKIANTIAHIGPAVFLIALSYSPEGDLITAITLLTFTVGLNGANYVGYGVNHIDLSPKFAATLMGFTNSIANFVTILAPLSVGYIIKDEKVASEWRIVFLIAVAIYILGNTCFVIFGSAEVQPWNNNIKSVDVLELENGDQNKEKIAENK